MSRFILVQLDDYERQYRESMIYLNSKYHDQPTKLKSDIQLSQAELDRIAIHGKVPDDAPHPRNTPIGKLVI